MCLITNDNINRETKGELSSDPDGLNSLEKEKCQI